MKAVLRPTAETSEAQRDDRRLVEALRRGDEAAFELLLERHHASMLRASLAWVSSHAVAEEVVQDTWLRVLHNLDRFEGRSTLRTWIFTILGNCARRRAKQEGRSIPFAALAAADDQPGPVVDADNFFPVDHPRWASCWTSLVDGRFGAPEEVVLSHEMRDVVRSALAVLPRGQCEVMTLRDVEGWSADEVCSFLDLTPENQRVLLHRARARVREAIRSYVDHRQEPSDG